KSVRYSGLHSQGSAMSYPRMANSGAMRLALVADSLPWQSGYRFLTNLTYCSSCSFMALAGPETNGAANQRRLSPWVKEGAASARCQSSSGDDATRPENRGPARKPLCGRPEG